MTAPAQIPSPAHILAETMLSRRFGKETANYFSSSPINRLSFLRNDHSFISSALKHPSTKFLLLNKLAPLTRSPAEPYYAQYDEVRGLIPQDLFDKTEDEMLKEFDSRKTHPNLIFLGLDESRKESNDLMTYKNYAGHPFFAVDVTPGAPMSNKALAPTRVIMTFPPEEAAVYAQARALMDWNTRNTFCGTCGQRTLSINAGTKRACPPTDVARFAEGLPPNRPECNTRTTLSNLSFPRTDPTIIVAVVSADGKRILLGRSKRFPPKWYSTLAGFIEPGESIEDAVRREVWEESGVTLSRVVIHSSQPWPYPANLMIGAVAQCSDAAHEKISLEHDPELEDARWFEIEEVEEALRIGTSDLSTGAGPEYKGGLRLPPATAIAHQLIQAAVNADYFQADKSKM
ncbi:hypothetical protein N7539_000388 [Penicillium diatomitis]|uniref:NAD(+) diphosphatase n=1 Tax=Penicillium diatomitis TaxID=2819901 RepID=A0A9W9XLK6_9EURO|nr:uncharacterized protein N7539_000388 [Penicillium diatomitis]KAJ5495272.1 hypothetical protein N7539_000388 [Penicillium diatomitis]